MADADIIDLVRRLQQRNETAFRDLMERYKTCVHSIAYGRVRNSADAEEISQMVFVEVYKHVSELKEPADFLKWIHGITDNVSLNWLRKYRKGAVSLDSLNREIAGKDKSPLERMIDNEETRRRTEEAMKVYHSLEPEYRMALGLKYMEGLSYDEIAERLGVTKDIVRGRLYRAHQALRTMTE